MQQDSLLAGRWAADTIWQFRHTALLLERLPPPPPPPPPSLPLKAHLPPTKPPKQPRICQDTQGPAPCLQIWITSPTWSNHHNIFRDAGVERKEYRYYKAETRGLDLDGLLEDLKVSWSRRRD